MAVNNPYLKQLYLTGYIMSYAGWYFNHVVIAEHLSQSAEPIVLDECGKLITWVKGQSEWFMQNIPHVNRVAKTCELAIPDVPISPNEYFAWAGAAHKAFYQLFPLRSPEQLTFTFGFDLGNMSCNLELMKTFLFLNFKLSEFLTYNKQLDYLCQDLGEIEQRTAVTAALLQQNADTRFLAGAWNLLQTHTQQVLNQHPEIPDAQQHLLTYETLLQILPDFHNTWSALLDMF